MSDALDAELAAAYAKATNGSDVIDTESNGSIKPDTRPQPGKPWHPAEQEESEEPVDADDELSKLLDGTIRKKAAEIYSPSRAALEFHNAPPMPESFSKDSDPVEATARWLALPIEERRAIAKVGKHLGTLVAEAKQLGIEVKTASDLRAVQDMLAGEKKSEAEPVADESADSFFGKYAPDAKDAESRWQWLNERAEHYAKIEADFAADPIKAGRELILAKQMHPLSLLTNEELIEHSVGLHGQWIDPARYSEWLQWMMSGVSRRDEWQAELDSRGRPNAEFIAREVAAFAADKGEEAFAEHEKELTELLETKFKNEASITKALEKAWAELQRRVAKRPRKSKMDQTIDRLAEEIYSRKAAA